jgi:hypothetical protein
MNGLFKKRFIGVALLNCLPGLALAAGPKGCKHDMLKGQYVFTATGFARAADGSWYPKGIVEYIELDGNGNLSVPAATVANRTNDGQVASSPPGGIGVYALADDCTGTLEFTPGPGFNILVAPRGDEFWMIQMTLNNAFQGNVKRLW